MTDVSFFRDSDALEDESVYRNSYLNYSLTFRTTIPDGVLLEHGISREYFLLRLVQGVLVFSSKLVDSATVHTAAMGESLNDGEWHKVVIRSDDLQIFDVSVSVNRSNIPPGASCGDTCTTTLSLPKSHGDLFMMMIGGDGIEFGKESLTSLHCHIINQTQRLDHST